MGRARNATPQINSPVRDAAASQRAAVEVSREQKSNALWRVDTHETTSRSSAVMKSDFRIVRTIGRGTYGKVYLVQHIATEQIYAMKSVQKELLIKTD